MKKCSKCGIEKSESEFPTVFGKRRMDGTKGSRLHSQCRSCRYLACKNWFNRNPGYSTEKKNEWNQNNIEHSRQYRAERKLKHSSLFKKWKTEWDKKNKEHSYEYRQEQIKNLSEVYLRNILINNKGFTKEQIESNPELLTIQKAIIQIKRYGKQHKHQNP